MSGTSGDGIDVALVRVRGAGFLTRFELLAHRAFPYPASVRRTVLSLMNAPRARVADLARLNFLLGELYADAILATARKARLRLELAGCHGQTLYHQGESAAFLGRRLAVTWQTGEGAVIAHRVGVPVVTDFRPADMAAGGKGAPLVPFVDYLIYRHSRRGRIVQNIGGIANLTAIPAGASPSEVVAFDTGPGNMVIDAVTERLFHRPYDRNGAIAARGRPLDGALKDLLGARFFRQPPPKTAGREEFGREFVSRLLRRCRGARGQDVVATATALTAYSIALAVRRFVLPSQTRAPRFHDYIVSGGGARNRTLLRMIGEQLPELRVRTSAEDGLRVEAKEAVAFALLAYQSWRRLPGNLPAATGAKEAAVLGKISYA